MTLDERKLNFLVFSMIYSGAAYLALAIFTDLRIDKLRPYINDIAIKIAVTEAVNRYESEQILDRPIRERKRAERDKEVMKYLRHLEKLLQTDLKN